MGQVGSGAQRPLMTGYALDYLNLDSRYSISLIVSALQQRPSGSLCFYGLPGRGKTALAEHIADALGRPPLAKRTLDLLSEWRGDSEQNTAYVLREAGSEQAELQFDEADSLPPDFLPIPTVALGKIELRSTKQVMSRLLDEQHDSLDLLGNRFLRSLMRVVESGAQRPFVQRLAGRRSDEEQARRIALATLDTVDDIQVRSTGALTAIWTAQLWLNELPRSMPGKLRKFEAQSL